MIDDEHDDPDKEVTAFLAPARRDIAEYGYHLTHVLGDRTGVPYCYSVGLWQTWRHPELLLYGLNRDDTVTVMTALAEEIRDMQSFVDGQIDEETFNRKIAFVEVPPERYEGQIPITILYNRGFDFPLLQVDTPDEKGRFPWDAECDPTVAAKQPLLGTPPA